MLSKYRIHVEVSTGDGHVYVIQKKWIGVWWTMAGKYLILGEVVEAYNELE